MSRSYYLYKLQLVDLQIDNALARVSAIKDQINDNLEIEKAKQVLAEQVESRDLSQNKLSSAEQSVNSQKIKIEQTESTLYSGTVKNPKELQALQEEVQALKRYLTILEDRYLDAMIDFEEKQEKFFKAQNSVEMLTNEKANLVETLNAENDKLSQRIEALTIERKQLLPKIDADDIRLYEDIRKSKKGVAVSKIVDKACGACGTTLTAALYQAAKSPSKLVRCATCKRILYYSS